MPDRHLLDTEPGGVPTHENVQQLVEAERGLGSQGVHRRWQASDSSRIVLVSDSLGVQISRDNGVTAPTNVINVGTPAGGNLGGTYPNPTLTTAIIDALVPPGTVMGWAGAGAAYPSGWLPCDGALAATAAYPKLYAAIGLAYNTGGEPGGTFRLPNLNGRVILGASGSHPLGQSAGAETVTGPTHTHLATHNHGLNSHTHGPGLHTHGMGSMQTHVHREGDHTHGQGTHTHTHGHTHDLDHNHALAAGVAVASGAITGVHEGPSAVVNVSANGHAHDVDLPALGTVASGVASAGSTDGPSANPSGGLTGTFDTGQPTVSVPNTNPPGLGDTAAATGSTADASPAPAADYAGVTVPTMMPFTVLNFIIRAG